MALCVSLDKASKERGGPSGQSWSPSKSLWEAVTFSTSVRHPAVLRWTDQRIGACWLGMFGFPADVFKVLPEAAAAGTFTRHQGAFTWRGAVITLG